MKRLLAISLMVGIIVMMMSCHNKSNDKTFDETEVQNGDLLFVGLSYDYQLVVDSADMDAAIVESTCDNADSVNYIHVAILERDENGQIWVVDATIRRGVDRYPLDTFLVNFTLNDGTLPRLEVMRLKDNTDVDQYVTNARQFCGRPYDVYFGTSSDSLYCSELVRDSYITAKGDYIFSEAPMNFKRADGTFPAYWEQLFALIKQPIPQGKNGTNPNAMRKESCLKYVGELKNDLR